MMESNFPFRLSSCILFTCTFAFRVFDCLVFLTLASWARSPIISPLDTTVCFVERSYA